MIPVCSRGEYAYAHLPQGAKVLHLGGDLGYQTSIDRRQGFVDGLKERIKSDWDGNVLNENGDVEVLFLAVHHVHHWKKA